MWLRMAGNQLATDGDIDGFPAIRGQDALAPDTVGRRSDAGQDFRDVDVDRSPATQGQDALAQDTGGSCTDRGRDGPGSREVKADMASIPTNCYRMSGKQLTTDAGIDGSPAIRGQDTPSPDTGGSWRDAGQDFRGAGIDESGTT